MRKFLVYIEIIAELENAGRVEVVTNSKKIEREIQINTFIEIVL